MVGKKRGGRLQQGTTGSAGVRAKVLAVGELLAKFGEILRHLAMGFRGCLYLAVKIEIPCDISCFYHRARLGAHFGIGGDDDHDLDARRFGEWIEPRLLQGSIIGAAG